MGCHSRSFGCKKARSSAGYLSQDAMLTTSKHRKECYSSSVCHPRKKEPAIKQVNERLLKRLDPAQLDVILRQVEAAEMDEMWSFVGSKSQQRWLWHALDHHTGQILAYVFGTREDETFLQLQELLTPFGITHFYTDGWGAYRRHLDPRTHTVGKQHTQKIERKHLTLRTRIKRLTRKTICFSRSILMHDLVVGLFINRYEFGYAV